MIPLPTRSTLPLSLVPYPTLFRSAVRKYRSLLASFPLPSVHHTLHRFSPPEIHIPNHFPRCVLQIHPPHLLCIYPRNLSAWFHLWLAKYRLPCTHRTDRKSTRLNSSH